MLRHLSRQRLSLLNYEDDERLDRYAAPVDAFVHVARLDQNGFARFNFSCRLPFNFEGEFTFKHVPHECAGMGMPPFASVHGKSHRDEQYLMAGNRLILLKQDLPLVTGLCLREWPH
jgi:hypothetical protein